MRPASSLLVAALPLCGAWTCAPAGSRSRARAPVMEATSTPTAEIETELLKLCALTDRGQRATGQQRQQIRFFIEALEAAAPVADATDLNGEWRLLAALEDTPYRSSPFFWAFRQATAKFTTPVGIPSSTVPSGGPLSSAVYAITDSIPFYDIGAVVQRISGVCSLLEGCPTEDDMWGDETLDGYAEESTPSEGTEAPPPTSGGVLESEVELIIGRNFGLPAAKSYMTTTCTCTELLPDSAAGAGVASGGAADPVDVELRVETTAARQSTLASNPLFASLNDFKFPSGDTLDALSPRASRVRLRTTYLTPRLRVSRPVLDLADAPSGSEADAVFVYARA